MYKFDSKYSKKFTSDQLTNLKYNLLIDFAVLLRDFKNLLSKEVNSDLLKFINIGKYGFITYMRSKYPKYISSYFDSLLYTLVYTCYQNRFNAILHRITFKKQIFVQFNLYKRYTKDHKKGDLKSITYKKETTNLSTTLTYLARYGCENILDIINQKYNDEKTTEDKRKFYDVILRIIDKFGFDRLYKLALTKRNRIINSKKYEKPIEFISLSFSGKTSCIYKIIGYNKNRLSKISGFITINVPFRTNNLSIPIKILHNFHGNINDYKKSDKKDLYSYTITFDEYTKSINVILCKDGERELPEDKVNTIGIDINLKHNLFALSDGTFYDFDRELVNDYIKLLNKIDNQKKINKDYQPGKHKRIILQRFQRRLKTSNLTLISNVCKDLKSKGYDHIVLENLDNSFGKSYSKNEEFNEKYNRLSHILNIGSLKDEFKHIAVKYDISVSFVLSEYTSLMCTKCGCIHDENRLTLEEFCCIECGDKMNADTHAAINIKNRVDIAVLQTTLLNKQHDGSYLPKKLSHDKVCEKIRKSIGKITKNILVT